MDARALGMFYVEVVQEVLMYVSETWFVYLRIAMTLGGFQKRVVYRLRGSRQGGLQMGRWFTPHWQRQWRR